MSNQRLGDWIQTWSGKRLYPLDPRPEEICIEDIAHSLARICRYGGHVDAPLYSVAEHSVIISRYLDKYINIPPISRLIGLLHDAAEGLGFSDLPKPIKIHFPEYEKAEKKFQHFIFNCFGISDDDIVYCKSVVKSLDTRILITEKNTVFRHNITWGWEDTCAPLKAEIEYWSPDRAKSEFLDRFYELTNEK